MDRIDFQIAALMDCNEKKSFTEIAQTIGINEKTVRTRVAQMVERGTINHSVLLDIEEFQEVYIAFSAIYGDPNINLKKISELPSVLYVTSVTGRYEAMAVIVIKARKELAKFNKQISTIEGVDRIETFMVIDNLGLKIPARMLHRLMNQEETNGAPPENEKP
jgi:DNA-binding Lrp family transcriptional regulator